MNQKKVVIVILAALVLVVMGVFMWKMRSMSQSEQITQKIEQPEKIDEIEGIKDLIDGEYAFAPIDTSDWQTYRNEEIGFEVKIPKNWEMREIYKEDNKVTYLWFSEKGEWYNFEGGKENAIVTSVSFKTNPFFHVPEISLRSWKNSYDISIKNLTVNGVPLYFHTGFGEGIDTTASFPRNYSFSISSSLVLDGYPDVRRVLHGMVQSLKFL